MSHRNIRAPRGTELSCRSWPQEAAMRMLMNNLDPEVAERPEDLVVYGGTGRAARSWEAYDAIVRTLRTLGDDETLLVQSGKPVAVFRTHDLAPRVLISNSMLVPKWADWETFRALEAQGLTMYGQMTAGSWIYIGTQGILQGTYETLAECAHQHFGGSLAGTITLTGGLGGMGGAQPLAVTMNGGVALCVDVDPARIERRIQTRYLDRMTADLDEAVAWAEAAKASREADLDRGGRQHRRGLPRVARARVRRRRGHRPDQRARPARRVRARGVCRCPRPMRSGASRMSTSTAPTSRWPTRWTPWWASPQAGSVVFDYGNNLRAGAVEGGLDRDRAYSFPGFVPAFVRPLFCEGKGPFRWAALSGDPADIAATDRAVAELFPDNDRLHRWLRDGRRACRLPGAARTDLLARLRRARSRRGALQRDGGLGRGVGADRDRARSPGRRQRRQPQPRDRGHAGRVGCDRRLADPQRA